MAARGSSFRVLGLMAILGVVAVFALPVIVPMLRSDQHIRRTDVGAAPADQVNPTARADRLPQNAPMNSAEVLEMLRQHGYLDVSDLAKRENGAWTARAQKEADGRRLTVTVDRNGEIKDE
ncbi:MAG: hypothetical protein ACLQJR_22545 [Stellaceae bacterium]